MPKLSQLDVRSSAEIAAPLIVQNRFVDPVEQPDGTVRYPAFAGKDGTPFTLYLLGAESTVARRHEATKKATFQGRMMARAIAAAARRSGNAPQTPTSYAAVNADDILAQHASDVDKAVACCTGWSGIEDDNDQPLPFSPEAARTLFESNADILAQAIEFIEDTRRLFR